MSAVVVRAVSNSTRTNTALLQELLWKPVESEEIGQHQEPEVVLLFPPARVEDLGTRDREVLVALDSKDKATTAVEEEVVLEDAAMVGGAVKLKRSVVLFSPPRRDAFR